MQIQPASPAKHRYGGKWIEFMGYVQQFPSANPFEPRKFVIKLPIRDRRVARRISRDTGQKFRMVNGFAEFREHRKQPVERT